MPENDVLARAKGYRSRCEMCCGGYDDPVTMPGWVFDELIALAEMQAEKLERIRAIADGAATASPRKHPGMTADEAYGRNDTGEAVLAILDGNQQ